MKEKTVKIVSVGICPDCGKQFVRDEVCTHAVCTCSSVVEVALHPAFLLPSKLSRKFERIVALIKEQGVEVSMEDFVNKLLDVGLKDYMAKQKWKMRC